MAAHISGYALQWNQPATIGGVFIERFARGAFDKSLRNDRDHIAALWSHDSSRPLARVSNGTLELRSDSVGLWYAITPDPESPLGQEALATVGRGTVDQVSVGFSSLVEEWSDKDDMPERLITEARLHELSLVLWAAYGARTSAAVSRADNAAAARRRIADRQARMEAKFRGILR